MEQIYLDNAATTPMADGVVQVITNEMKNDFGNASSTHQFGRRAREQVDAARKIIAGAIHSQENEIVFTSGGSESNNTAIFGTAQARKNLGRHIITTKIEHPSVLNPMAKLASLGYQITYLDVDETGHISLDQLKKALTPQTILVSVMAVNNEVGSIMPLSEIGRIVAPTQAYFHVDAVQGFGNLDLDVEKMKIDLLSTSAHKINGPKFLGFLYERRGIKLDNLILGGEQELKRRAGTENVPGIAGFGEAVREMRKIDKTALQKRYTMFQDLILSALKKQEIDFEVNGTLKEKVSHHVLNIWLKGIDTYVTLTNLDLAGFAVSGGSACTAGSLEPSHVLTAMYGSESPRLKESIRISFGRLTKKRDVEAFASELAAFAHKKQLKA